MKKVISFVLILALVLVVTGCSSSSSSSSKNLGGLVPNIGSGKTIAGSSASAAPAVTAQASSAIPGSSSAASVSDNGIVKSIQAFYTEEYGSLQPLYTKIQSGEEDQNLNKSVQASYALYQCTLSVMPIEAIAGGDFQSTMEENGASDIKISKNGDVYTMSFNTQEITYKIEAQYDSSTDSMTAKMYASDQLVLTFEYAAQSNGYAAQAYTDNGSGGLAVYTGFVDGSKVSAFGMTTATAAPQSIFKNKSLSSDFVKSGSFYCVFNGSTLTVTDSGTTTNY